MKIENKKNKEEIQKAVVQDKKQRLIYLGPNLAKYGLTKAMVFIGGLPKEQAKELFEKEPLVKTLFVPTNKIAEAKQAIKTIGTPQNKIYKKLLGRGE